MRLETMRTNILMTTPKILLLAMSLMGACSKTRPTQWPQGEEDAIFEKSYVTSQQMILKTAPSASSVPGTRELKAIDQMPEVDVAEVDGSERLKPLFKDLKVEISADQGQLVKFRIDRKYVTAYKVISKDSLCEVSVIEQELALKEKTQILVPIFQSEILEQGIVEAVKNDLGEDTNVLRIKPTEPDLATHIKFSTLATARIPVGFAPDDSLEEKQILLKSRINGIVLTKQEILDKVNVQLSDEGRYLLKFGGEKLSFLKILKLRDLNQDLKAQIRAQDNGAALRSDLFRCSQDILAQLPDDARSDCIAALSYDVPATSVVAKRHQVDATGTLGASLYFENTIPVTGDGLIRIVYRTQPREVNLGGQIVALDPTKTLVVDELKNAEFFFRRTLQDSPNGFQYTFAGSSGPLDLVKFVFEKNQVRVARVDALLMGDGANEVDQETIMSLPATYIILKNTDEAGNLLASPRTVPASFDDKGAIAIVDWTENTIPTVDSPLEYYSLEQCFDGAREKQVSDLDSRLAPEKGGMLSFSLQTTYAASRSTDCAGLMDESYFDVTQKSFTFKERISFMRHTAKPGEAVEPWLQLPFEAQRRLGFGLFTYSKKKPDNSGRINQDGTVIPLPAIFDLRNAKKINYVLAGLPQGSDARSSKIREVIIASTKRVIDDLNLAFKKALAGTALERTDEIVQLSIEGGGAAAGQLGDLDKNHIYYIQKATESGIIGLGGAHHNPRSGEVESASVYLYGGNMLSMIEDLREVSKIRKDYLAHMNLGGPAPAVGVSAMPLASTNSKVEQVDSMKSMMTLVNDIKAGKIFKSETLALSDKLRHF